MAINTYKIFFILFLYVEIHERPRYTSLPEEMANKNKNVDE